MWSSLLSPKPKRLWEHQQSGEYPVSSKGQEIARRTLEVRMCGINSWFFPLSLTAHLARKCKKLEHFPLNSLIGRAHLVRVVCLLTKMLLNFFVGVSHIHVAHSNISFSLWST